MMCLIRLLRSFGARNDKTLKNYKKILFINPFGIGDVLFTTPLLDNIKDTLPEAKIGYLCNRRAFEALENNPSIDKIFIYERDEFVNEQKKSFWKWLSKTMAFINDIKQEKYEIAFDFSLNSQYGLISWLSGIKERVGYDYKGRGKFLNQKIPLDGYKDKHVVDYYAKLIDLKGFNFIKNNLKIYPQADDINKADEALKESGAKPGQKIIVVIPGGGASWGKDALYKQWPINYFLLLCDKIIAKYKAKIIIMGNSAESNLCRQIKDHLKSNVLDLSGSVSLRQMAAICAKSDLVICNDGGPLHIAVASKAKTVSIFGPVDEKVYGPYPYGNHLVITEKVTCRPCYQNFRFPGCNYEIQCLKKLTPDKVFAACQKILG